MTSSSTKTNIKPSTHSICAKHTEARQHPDRILFRLDFFEARSGNLVALVGANGAGKSTLLKAFMGERNGIQLAGALTIDGLPVTQYQSYFKDGLLAWLPQTRHPLFGATVLQHVLMGLHRTKPFWQPFLETDLVRARQQLEQHGIGHLADQEMTTLSGGEQQLVWMAQLAMQQAAIILLDEPTQQLDLYNKRKVMDVLGQWAEAGKLVLFSTHDLYLLHDYKVDVVFLNGMQSGFYPAADSTTISQVANTIEQR